jgi:hypothetical protein
MAGDPTMTRTSRLLTGGALAALATSALLIATGAPALAHYTVVQQGRDMASVSADHARGSVCDRERDGDAVYGKFWTGSREVREWDGGDPGCDNVELQSHEVIKQVEVCENTNHGTGKDACSGWVLTHPWGSNVSSAE